MGLVGESGCGKSVTSLSIMRLLSPPGEVEGGEVIFDGQDLLKLPESKMRDIRGDRISMIFQQPTSSLNPVLTVGDQIGEVLETHRGMKRKAAARTRARAAADGRHPRPGAAPRAPTRTRCRAAWRSA